MQALEAVRSRQCLLNTSQEDEVTTIQCTGDTLKIVNEGRTAHISVESALTLATDCDIIESITLAWRNKGEVITVPNISNAKGLRPRAAQRHGVIQ
jgi:hypothetical protein